VPSRTPTECRRYCRSVAAEWVGDVEAVTITLVQGLTSDAVGDLLRVEWASRRDVVFSEAEGQLDVESGEFPVQLQELGDWILVVEPYGYFTSLPEVAEALSRRGRCVGIFWNVNAVMQFLLAEAWGSSSCATRPVRIERTGAQEVELRVRRTDGREACTVDASPTTNEVVLPDGVSTEAPLEVVIDDGGEQHVRLTLQPPQPGG
jgi:hypothetical protein